MKWRYFVNYGKTRGPPPLTCVSATKRISRKGNMLRQFALAVLLSGSALAQTHAPVEPHLQQLEQLDEIRGRQCEVPEGFGCGILFDLDLPESGNMNLSVVGGVVHQISVILNGTMYTVVYDPPLKRDFQPEEIRSYSCTN